MFTDNSTTESAFWKGTSHSKKLCDLVVRLRKLEMDTGMILHVIHVSGRRMIHSGVDGLSRGDHTTGIMAGHDTRDYIPLHLDAFERSPALKEWVCDITQGLDPTFLTPEGWFEGADKEGVFVWSPPPCAADVVVERLGVAKHKRPNSLHLVVVPRIMTGRWRKHLSRATDCYFRIKSSDVWNVETEFEPVLVFVSLPFLPHKPALNWRRNLCERLHGVLQETDLQKPDSKVSRTVLRELLSGAGSLPCL